MWEILAEYLDGAAVRAHLTRKPIAKA